MGIDFPGAQVRAKLSRGLRWEAATLGPTRNRVWTGLDLRARQAGGVGRRRQQPVEAEPLRPGDLTWSAREREGTHHTAQGPTHPLLTGMKGFPAEPAGRSAQVLPRGLCWGKRGSGGPHAGGEAEAHARDSAARAFSAGCGDGRVVRQPAVHAWRVCATWPGPDASFLHAGAPRLLFYSLSVTVDTQCRVCQLQSSAWCETGRNPWSDCTARTGPLATVPARH